MQIVAQIASIHCLLWELDLSTSERRSCSALSQVTQIQIINQDNRNLNQILLVIIEGLMKISVEHICGQIKIALYFLLISLFCSAQTQNSTQYLTRLFQFIKPLACIYLSEKPAALDQPVTHKELEALKKDKANDFYYNEIGLLKLFVIVNVHKLTIF